MKRFGSAAGSPLQVTPRFALQADIFVDELVKPCRAEAREMAAMHDRDIQAAHSLQRRQIVADVGMIGVVDQRPVINDVA